MANYSTPRRGLAINYVLQKKKVKPGQTKPKNIENEIQYARAFKLLQQRNLKFPPWSIVPYRRD